MGKAVALVYGVVCFAFLIHLASKIGDVNPSYTVDWHLWFTGLAMFLGLPIIGAWIVNGWDD